MLWLCWKSKLTCEKQPNLEAWFFYLCVDIQICWRIYCWCIFYATKTVHLPKTGLDSRSHVATQSCDRKYNVETFAALVQLLLWQGHQGVIICAAVTPHTMVRVKKLPGLHSEWRSASRPRTWRCQGWAARNWQRQALLANHLSVKKWMTKPGDKLPGMTSIMTLSLLKCLNLFLAE